MSRLLNTLILEKGCLIGYAVLAQQKEQFRDGNTFIECQELQVVKEENFPLVFCVCFDLILIFKNLRTHL